MIDVKEAIEILDNPEWFYECEIQLKHGYWEASEMAIEALNKQIPAKPMLVLLQSGEEITVCQNCECEIKHYQNYCLRCGQAIDWSKAQEVE